MNIEDLKRLAGIDKPGGDASMGENLSYIGTAKSQYQKKTQYTTRHRRVVQIMVRKA